MKSGKVLAGYAAAEAGIVGTEVLIQLYLLKFYTDVVGLRPELAGTALALAVIWDAITDPWMGAISDRTSWKTGRRRSFIAIGGALLFLSLPVLFFPPALDGQGTRFAYLLFSYMLVNTSLTILSVPHSAFGGELTLDPAKRTLVVGLRLLFGNIGLMAGTILPGVFLALGALDPDPKARAALVVAVIVLVTSMVTFASTASADRPGERQTGRGERVVSQIYSMRKNIPFLVLFAALLVATIGRTVNSSLALYYYEYRLGLSEKEVVLYVLGLFIIVISLSVPFWVWLSRRIGKIPAAFSGILALGVMTITAYPLFPPHDLRGPLFAAVAGGIAVGSIVLLESLLADIVDLDELQTRRHREGLYFGVWKMGAKASRAVGLAMSGFLLSWSGAESGASAGPEAGWRLALAFGPLVGVFFVAGAVLFAFLPYREAVHARVQKILRDRASRAHAAH